jgi:phenylacetate-CoA ligase
MFYRHWLTTNLLFPLAQQALRNRFWDYYSELLQTDYASEEELLERQRERLKCLVRHAYETVPMYQEIFRERGLRGADIQSKEDLTKLPVITKDTFRRNFPDRCVSANAGRLIHNHTSGSTGVPFHFFMDSHLVGMRYARYLRGNTWAGLKHGETYLRLWGPKSLKMRLGMSLILNVKTLSAFNMTPARLQQYLAEIRRMKPAILECYASAAARLARYMEAEGETGVGASAVVSSGETLNVTDRRLMEQVFECPIFNRYGCREFGAIAHECEAHNGLHLNMESFIVEIVDENGMPTSGEGQIVITNLDNFAMPFIRYSISDIGRMLEYSEQCQCGRQLAQLDNLSGRVVDYLETNSGKMISVHFFTLLFGENGTLFRDFQICQRAPDKLTIQVVPNQSGVERAYPSLEHRIKAYLGDEVTVSFEAVDKIPLEPNGKRMILKRL